MSKDVDRSKVLKSIKVMKAVKKDGSWIHKANPGKKEQDKSRTDVAKDNSSSPVKKKSYVLSAIQKYETRVSAEELSKNDEVQPELAIANTAEENKGGYANICVEGHVQNGDAESVSLSKGNPEAREENKEEYPDTSTYKDSTIPDMMVSQSPTGSHAVPEDVVKSLPETPGDDEVLQGAVELVPLLVPKSPPQSALSAIVKDVEDEDKSVAPTEGVSETRSETSVGTRVPAEELSKNGEVQPGIAVASTAQQATPGDEEVLQGAVEPIPVPVPATVISEESAAETTEDTKNISPPVLSAITKFKDVDESAAPTQEVSKTRSEEAVECEHNTITEQSAESVPTNAEDYLLRELNINDALEPVNDLEANAVQGKYSDRGIKLTDALDVQPPTVDTVAEPVEDPEQSELSDQAKMNQSDDAHITEMSQKPDDLLRCRTCDVKAVCSFCDRIIDGKTKLIVSEPAVICHPECLKCSVCAKTLGDLLTRMFLYHQGIHCDDCFANALVA